MARFPHESRPDQNWTPPAKAATERRVVRLGRPANDNFLHAPAIRRGIGVAAGLAVVIFGLRWLGVI